MLDIIPVMRTALLNEVSISLFLHFLNFFVKPHETDDTTRIRPIFERREPTQQLSLAIDRTDRNIREY